VLAGVLKKSDSPPAGLASAVFAREGEWSAENAGSPAIHLAAMPSPDNGCNRNPAIMKPIGNIR
jgi:hypothetical protein